MNVTQLSKAIGFEPENLLKQMSAAGLSHKSITDEVNNEDKKTLLTFLKSSKKTSKKTISLKKDTLSTKKSISIRFGFQRTSRHYKRSILART